MKSSLLDNNFNVIAYRGGTTLYPENSPAAIRHSVNINPQCIIEIDLQLTKDNEIIAFHDFQLNHLTNGNGLVIDHNIADLRKIKLRNPDGTLNDTTHISTLHEIFDIFPQQRFILDLHVMDPVLINSVAEIVTDHHREGSIAIQSVNDNIIEEFQALRPGWTFVTAANATRKFAFASKLRLEKWVKTTADIMFLPEKLGGISILGDRALNVLHQRKVKVWSCVNFKPYTNVNSLADMQRLRQKGVDGVFTDDPGSLIVAGRK
jgi:glycerophosphoryl diester phosphodiesterase